MTVSLSPILNGWQGFTTTGLPLNAGLVYQYAAGTTTPQATFTTNLGNVQNANPIVLGPDGRPPQEIWLTDGLSYKFQVNDSLNNPIATYDNIQSVGTLIQNFINSTTFLTSADGRYPIYAGTAGGTSDAITAAAATSITALYNGMIVSIDAILPNATATPTFTLTLGSTVTATLTIVDYNLQPLAAGAIAGLGHKILLGYNSVQGKWLLINPMPVTASGGTTSRRQTALIGPVDISGMPSFLPQTVTGLTLTTQNINGVETTQTANVTTAVASPGVVGWTGHTLVGNQAVSFTTNGALPTGLTVGTTYYVVPGATLIAGTSFQVSATPGGAAINFTGVTSGQSVCWAGIQLPLTAAAWYGNDGVAGELNQVGQATANFSFPTLPNGQTNYLYSTISTLGVFTHFSTTLAPVVVYGSTTTPSVTSGQITIDVVRGETYLGNGSAAVETTLVVWGTATTSGGNITATSTYIYGDKPQDAAGGIKNPPNVFYEPGVNLSVPINISSATTDVSLNIGQVAYADYSALTTIPLHIATADKQVYEIEINGTYTAAAAGVSSYLGPNNTTYAGAIVVSAIYSTNNTAAAVSSGAQNYFILENVGASIHQGRFTVTTSTLSKGVTGTSLNTNSTTFSAASVGGYWNDTTTPWTSLGTITMPNSWTGRITIRRMQ